MKSDFDIIDPVIIDGSWSNLDLTASISFDDGTEKEATVVMPAREE